MEIIWMSLKKEYAGLRKSDNPALNSLHQGLELDRSPWFRACGQIICELTGNTATWILPVIWETEGSIRIFGLTWPTDNSDA